MVAGLITLVSQPSPNNTMLVAKGNTLTFVYSQRVAMRRGLSNIVLRRNEGLQKKDKYGGENSKTFGRGCQESFLLICSMTTKMFKRK